MKTNLLKLSHLYCLILLVVVAGCATQNSSQNRIDPDSGSVSSLTDTELETIRKDVSNLAISYFDAMQSLDAEAILSHVIKAPNFAYTRRGSRSNIEEFEIGTRNLVKNFTDKVSTIGPIAVDVIEPDVAVVTYTFEQTLTNTKGEKRDFNGTVSWVAIKRDGAWRYIHGLSYQ